MIRRFSGIKADEKTVSISEHLTNGSLTADEACLAIFRLQAVANAAEDFSEFPSSETRDVLIAALSDLKKKSGIEELSEHRTKALLRLESISEGGDRVGLLKAVNVFLTAEKAYQEAMDQ